MNVTAIVHRPDNKKPIMSSSILEYSFNWA